MPVLENARHEIFAQELAKGRSADEAYQTAGYSENRGNAARLKAHESIRCRVDELLEGAADRAEVTVSAVLSELAKIGFANMQDYIRINGEGDPVVDLSALDRDQAAAISEVTVNIRQEKGGGDDVPAEVKSVKFKLADKRAALVDLGKHLGMFKDRVELTGKDGGPIQTEDMSEGEVARRIAFALNKGVQAEKPTEH